MDDREVKKLFEGIKVPIAMEQRVPLSYAECCDQAIDCLSHSTSAASERPIVPRRLPREVGTACLEQFQFEETSLDIIRCGFIANALQHFAENDVRQPQALTIEFRIKPIRFRIPDTLEIVNPDGGVDDHHVDYFVTRPSREASRSPSQATLPRNRRMLF
jgi:hypothetical protein